jgi:hypothetical protein
MFAKGSLAAVVLFAACDATPLVSPGSGHAADQECDRITTARTLGDCTLEDLQATRGHLSDFAEVVHNKLGDASDDGARIDLTAREEGLREAINAIDGSIAVLRRRIGSLNRLDGTN